MFGFKRIRLFEVFGIPIYLDWSTIFIALMFLQSGSIFSRVSGAASNVDCSS